VPKPKARKGKALPWTPTSPTQRAAVALERVARQHPAEASIPTGTRGLAATVRLDREVWR